MPEKMFPTVSNCEFKCGRCARNIQINDPIIFMLPSKRRYCEDCGNAVYAKQTAPKDPTKPTTDTAAPDTEALKSLANRLAALETSFVQRVTALEARLDGLAYVDYRPELNELLDRLDKQGARINTINAQLQATAGLKK